MEQVSIFRNSEFGELGVVEIEGKPFFPAVQCAKVLGYSNSRDAVKRHCPGVVKRDVGVVTGIKADGTPAFQTTKTNYIPEGDLYRLIVRSKLPSAEKFERWVFDEVLPEIRRSGQYGGDIENIIARAVSAAVTETVKQILPLIVRTEARPAGVPVARRRGRKTVFENYKGEQSVIGRLDAQARQEVEEMLLDNETTYQNVQDYLREKLSIRLSLTAIGLYARRLLELTQQQCAMLGVVVER